MTLSMTGFGTGEASREGFLVKAELRSVNHRHFDPSIRISRGFAEFEGRVKEILSARIQRGRVSAVIEVEIEAARGRLTLDEGLAKQYADVFQTLRHRFDADGGIDPIVFAQLPDILRREVTEVPAEEVAAALEEALGGALDELVAMRQREGEALRRDLAGRVERIAGILDQVEGLAQSEPDRMKRRLEERIAKLLPDGAAPDAERLATEVALAADKADIVEEIVRFRAHDEAFLGFLEQDEPVGKRLDFLLQEMNREANTIGSKAVSAEVSHHVVEIKEEVERLREQVQNVE